MLMTYNRIAHHQKGHKEISIDTQWTSNKPAAEFTIASWNREGKIPRGQFPTWSYELISVV